MKRRSRAGGKSSKRTTLPRRRSAPTSARGHRSAVTRQETHVARLTRERDEALEQQAATSEILHVISNSPTNVQIAFNAIARSAARLCEAFDVVVYSVDGSVLRLVAHHGPMPAGDVPLHRGTVGGRTVIEGRLIHTRDLQAEVNEFPEGSAIARERGHRTNLSVPMLRGGVAIGNIQVRRQEVRPFSAKQISVLKTFADQAVIAVENSRLLNELRQRTTDLTEALDQQTATSEVLKVISNSPGDLVPVFESLLANAKHLCGAKFGTLLLREGNAFRTVAMHGATPEYTEARRHAPLIRPATDTGLGRVLKTKQAVQIADINEVPGYVANPMQAPIVHLAGARTMLSVPMLKEEELIGVIEIYRQEVLPFSSKQVELVKNFAAQAVIAIENARLLTELRQRTDDLGDALEQQTATSEVLRVISNSLSDTQPVFESIVRNGVTLFSEAAVSIALVDNDMVKAAAVAHRDPARAEAWRSVFPFPLTREYMHSKAILDGKMLDIPDVERASVDLTVGAKNFLRSGYRAVTIVPLMRGDQAIGALSVVRVAPGPLSDKQLATLKTYANQAIIAIENTRLLNELRQRTADLTQSLEQQTATSDVLKVISRSTFDLQTVLQTLVESATKLCDADNGVITRQKEGVFYRAETYGLSKEISDYIRSVPVVPERGTITGRALFEGKVVHIPDVQNDPDFTWTEAQRLDVFRTALGVPMLREGVPIGVFALTRSEVRLFTEKQIELVTTFADQAAIAIENVRLFEEIQDKSRQLEVASQHKSQFLANMSHELRTPLNAILGYTELMADGAYGEPSEKMLSVLRRLESNGKHLLGLINDVLDLSKIEAGQLVLELSDYSIQDIAQTVRSTLEPLASDKKLAFKLELAPNLPSGRGDGRRLTQVLINLVGNAIKFTDAGEVVITVEAKNGSFHLSVSDTGPGISAPDQAKLFQEFQQADNAITKKKGGTGLGLAISKRIIEMHAGKIWVESQPGQGSTFAFTLPVRVEQVGAA